MKPWQLKLGVTLISLIVGSGVFASYNAIQREIGRRDVLLSVTRADLKRAKVRIDSLERAYRVDTLRMWRTVRTLDTLTVNVERWKHDTLKVVEYVAKADTTIKACTMALSTCEARVGAERDGRLAAEKQVKLLQSQMPSKLTPLRHRIEGAVVGVAVSALVGVIRH